ncbi:MAG: GNAT family N-acetyltransferase [Chloroflexi bacterium]|nr:GNAT family N-acetyltransferase [Chloroflexota bacterium]
MNPQLRFSHPADLPFMKAMLYEAVFWRDVENRPAYEEALALPDVHKALADWGKREGDTALIATINGTPVGAAWYRYWNEKDEIRGYMHNNVPVIVIGVHEDFRAKKIGRRLLSGLIEQAQKEGVPRISLMVSKDNYALRLYQQQGFKIYSEIEDSITMVRDF